MDKKIYNINCERCGCEIVTTSPLKRYCTRCKREVMLEIKRKSMRRVKNRKKAQKELADRKSIAEVIQELEAYNKEHKTLLSYGQYVQMMRYGE